MDGPAPAQHLSATRGPFPCLLHASNGDLQTMKFSIHPIYTVSQKNIPDIFDCNVKKDYRILIIFGTNIPETTCRQVTI